MACWISLVLLRTQLFPYHMGLMTCKLGTDSSGPARRSCPGLSLDWRLSCVLSRYALATPRSRRKDINVFSSLWCRAASQLPCDFRCRKGSTTCGSAGVTQFPGIFGGRAHLPCFGIGSVNHIQSFFSEKGSPARSHWCTLLRERHNGCHCCPHTTGELLTGSPIHTIFAIRSLGNYPNRNRNACEHVCSAWHHTYTCCNLDTWRALPPVCSRCFHRSNCY